MLKSWYRSIVFSITLIIFNSLGLTAIGANESIQPIVGEPTGGNLQPPSDLKSSDRAFRAFKSIVDRYDCLSAATDTSFDRISQIDSRFETLRERAKFAKDLNSCTEQIQDLAGVAPADLEILKQLQSEFATEPNPKIIAPKIDSAKRRLRQRINHDYLR
jgi:hypothetical protein